MMIPNNLPPLRITNPFNLFVYINVHFPHFNYFHFYFISCFLSLIFTLMIFYFSMYFYLPCIKYKFLSFMIFIVFLLYFRSNLITNFLNGVMMFLLIYQILSIYHLTHYDIFYWYLFFGLIFIFIKFHPFSSF